MSVRSILLWGPPAVGKSTLGPKLAAGRHLPFVDLDQEIEARAQRTIADIFREEGEVGFRRLESQTLWAVLSRGPAVVATGAGALIDDDLRRQMLRDTWVIGLDAPLPVLQARAAKDPGSRPLLRPSATDALAQLLTQRRPRYREVHASVLVEDDLESTCKACQDALDELARTEPCVVPLREKTHLVHIGPIHRVAEHIPRLSPSATMWVLDDVVARLHAERVAMLRAAWRFGACVNLPGRGDADKTLATVEQLWGAALEAGFDRDSVLLAMGGGVTTDLAGFAAATLLRGVRFLSCPTTYLSMVDASVGGKTGIDRAHGKNLIGAFHQPAMVYCDPAFLATLALRERRSGLAEVAKIALVSSSSMATALDEQAASLRRLDPGALASWLRAAIQAKIDVVCQDEREQGVRAILNFGHTVGHAIEQGAGFRIPHGECVALGMRAALSLGESLQVTPPHVVKMANGLLDRLGMPVALDADVDEDVALRALYVDKKRQSGMLRFVLLEDVGRAVVVPVPRNLAEATLRQTLSSSPSPSPSLEHP